MGRALITFLGKGNNSTGYDAVRYVFGNVNGEPEGTIINDELPGKRAYAFGAALYKYLKQDLNKLIVVGTTGSSWHYICFDEIIENSGEFDEIESIQNNENLSQAEKVSTIQGILTNLCDKHNSNKNCKVQIYLKVVTDNMQYEDHIDFFSAVNNEINNNDKVILDITHGYKTMSLLGSSIVQYLKFAKNVTVEHIYYAWMKGKPVNDEPCEIIELRALQELNEWSSSFSKYDKSGDLSSFSELLLNTGIANKVAVDTINKASFIERLSNVDSTVKLPALSKTVNSFLENDSSPIFNVVKKQYKDRISNWIDKNNDYDVKINCSKNYLACGDYLRSVIYLFEGLFKCYKETCKLTKAEIDCEKSLVKPQDKDIFWKFIAFKYRKSITPVKLQLSESVQMQRIEQNLQMFPLKFCEKFEILKDIRNSLAHGAPISETKYVSGLPKPSDLMKDEAKLKEFIGTLIEDYSSLTRK